MWRVGGLVAFGILFLANGVSAQEFAAIQPEPPVDRSSVFMRVYGAAQPLPAFVRFCEEYPEECVATSGDVEKRLPASPQLLSELDQINRAVNRSIIPEGDLEHYGIRDYWTLPTDGKGDCEDYALLKRHALIELGWPPSALLMTVVIVSNKKDEAHAVLTVRTTAGDYILDNNVDEVRLWNQTPYHFLMRQSYLNPRAWIDLDPTRYVTPLPIAGVRRN
jgi:predicted transglutaminase-like cysteine proteinase